ncbi:MAG TPA: hypothetical protein VGM30_05695 [Puia sp.]
MDLQKYEYSTNDNYLEFEFDSEGPKGKTRKVIQYTPYNSNGVTYFSLSFGNLDPTTGKIDTLIVTNNNDREKTLATVAATVLKFTQRFPDMMVYAIGSTSARTRLYQMGISAYWNEIDSLLYVYGYQENKGWKPFRKDVNYQAFLIKRK